MNRTILRTVSIALALLATAAAAQDSGRNIPTTVEGWSGGEDVRALAAELGLGVGEEPLELTLDQTITLALQRNLTLVTQRYARSRTLLAIEEAVGMYDIGLGGNVGYTDSSTPKTSELQQGGSTITEETQTWNFSANRVLNYGADVTANFGNSRFATNNLIENFSPRFRSALTLTYRQALLQDAGREVTERNIIVARTNAAVSLEDYQTQVETIVQQASDGYWNLVEALEQLKVSEESLKQAEELHEMNKIQVEVGTKAPLEMVQSEATVASRREQIIQLRANVDDAADVLRRLVNLDRGANWDRPINPVTQPAVDFQPVDINAAIDAALANRPEIRRKKLVNETLALDARIAKNRTRPSLDLEASIGWQGIDGKLSSEDPVTGDPIVIRNNGWPDAVSILTDRDFEDRTIRLSFGYPLGNRVAKARLANAELAVDQGNMELRDLELQTLTEVRRAVRALTTAAERIESAKVASRLARENLDAERKRYENGMSTSFQVTEIQEDLSQALSSEVSAVIAYRRAETNYYLTVGNLLDKHGVELLESAE